MGRPSHVRPALIAPGNVYGGVEQFVFTYSVHLSNDRGITPLVILFHPGTLRDKLVAEGIHVEIVAMRRKYDPAAVSRVADLMRIHDVDVVHVHGYKASIVGSIAAKRVRVPVVKTEHGTIEPVRGRDRIKMSANHAIDRWVTSHYVDEVVYVSADLMERRRTRSRSATARVVYNGIAPSPAGGEPVSLDNGRFNIGIIGRVAPVKGHDLLLNALSRMVNRARAHVHVIGDGPSVERLREVAAERGVSDGVTFHGFVPNVRDYLDALDCVVMPSLAEGAVTYAVLEAMQAGVPIVATAVGGMAEVLRDDETALLVKPGDTRGLAAVLDKLIEDPDLQRRLGAAGAVAVTSFDIGEMSERYLGLYDELIERSSGAGRVWITWDRHRRSIELAEALRVPILVFERGRGPLTWYLAPLLRTARHLMRSRYRTVIVQNPSLVLAVIAAALRRVRGYTLVQDLHSYFASCMVGSSGLRDRVYRLLTHYCLQRCDLTIVTNAPLKRIVDGTGARTVVLPDKIPTFADPRRTPLAGAFNVVFICTYSADEPVDEVFRAASMVGDDVVIYVTGRPSRPDVADRAPKNVVVTGFLSEPDYVSLLNSADAILALTKRDHTLLCGAYEAVAARKPLVTSDTQVLREYFRKGTLYVDNTANSITDAIRTARARRECLERGVEQLATELEPEWIRRLSDVTKIIDRLDR